MLCVEVISDNLSELSTSCSGEGLVYTRLDLSNKSLSDINAISDYSELQHLDLSHNIIDDVTPIKTIHHLLFLNLSHNKIKAWPIQDSLFNLKYLDLSYNQLTSIELLTEFRLLTSLNLDSNKISSLPTELHNLKQLIYLSIANNSLQKINGLENLPIKTLNLHNNQLKRIESIGGMKYLQYIDLSSNQITSLRGLQTHPCLQDIRLDNNKIADLTDIKYLLDLKSLRELSFKNNFIQTLNDYRVNIIFKLPQLTNLDGEKISPKEKVNSRNIHDPPLEVQASIQHMQNLTLSAPLAHKLYYSTLSHTDEPYPMLVLVGPMGSGKKYLALKLVSEYPYIFGYAPSHTTRAPYPQEEANREYIYITEDDFKQQLNSGMFLEHYRGLAGGGKYGISVNTIESVAAHGLASITCMEYEGVLVLKRTHFEPRYVLVMPHTEHDHRDYMLSTKQYTEVQVEQAVSRRKIYQRVNQEFPGFFDTIISCASLEESYQQLKQLIVCYCGLSSHSSEVGGRNRDAEKFTIIYTFIGVAGFSSRYTSSNNSTSCTPEPESHNQLHDDTGLNTASGVSQSSRQTESGYPLQPHIILAKTWSRPGSSTNYNTARDDATVSNKHTDSHAGEPNYVELLQHKAAMLRAAVSGRGNSTSLASLQSKSSAKSHKDSHGSRSSPVVAHEFTAIQNI